MRKGVSILLFVLLLLHTLALAFVWFGQDWQQQQTLTRHLNVYRSVDSIIEFQIDLTDVAGLSSWHNILNKGFFYREHYYEPISLEIQGKRIVIACLETQNARLWSKGLVSLLQNYLLNWDSTNHQSGKGRKLVLSDYSIPNRQFFEFLHINSNQLPYFLNTGSPCFNCLCRFILLLQIANS